MATMTFQINDASTGTVNPAVWVTITENGDGTLSFSVTQEGGVVGDLRGLFFDMADESILKSLVVTAASTDIRIGDDSIKDLGDGANMNGLLGSDKGYDVGIEIGTSGIGKDDVRSYSFTLDSTVRDLTLADFAQVDFAARLTSVGVLEGTRADSSKILENTSAAVSLADESAVVLENGQTDGNLLDGLGLPGTTVLTGWSGGAVGEQVALSSDGDIIGTLRVNADGSYVLDASAADELSAGEEIVYDLSYSARNQTEATSWSDDTAAFTVKVVGTNDGPVAVDDAGGRVAEDGVLTGSVVANDSDVDRLDTHTWSLESFNGQGNLTFNADGTWSYDAAGAYDHLNEGESVELSFQYRMTDNHGASDVATVRFSVDGVGGAEPPPPPPPPAESYPDFEKDISHAILVFNTAAGDTNGDGYYTVKIDDWTGSNDLDAEIGGILSYLIENDANIDAGTELLGAQIKGGKVGVADGSYDDFWADDGSPDTTIVEWPGRHGDTITEVASTDTEPSGLDINQDSQTNVDQTYLYGDLFGAIA